MLWGPWRKALRFPREDIRLRTYKWKVTRSSRADWSVAPERRDQTNVTEHLGHSLLLFTLGLMSW